MCLLQAHGGLPPPPRQGTGGVSLREAEGAPREKFTIFGIPLISKAALPPRAMPTTQENPLTQTASILKTSEQAKITGLVRKAYNTNHRNQNIPKKGTLRYSKEASQKKIKK